MTPGLGHAAIEARKTGETVCSAPPWGVVVIVAALFGFPFTLAASAEEQLPRAIVPQDAEPNATPPAGTSEKHVAPLRENEAPDSPRLPQQYGNKTTGNGEISAGTGPFVIEMPALEIIGNSPLADAVITMPTLSIIGNAREPDLLVAMPEIVIIGKRNESEDEADDDDSMTGGLGQTIPDVGSAPSTPRGTTESTFDKTTALWCLGSYTGHAGRGTGTASGVVMPVGQVETVPVRVTAVACRQTLRAEIAGAIVTLAQTDASNKYRGIIDLGDGAARILTLTCDADLNMRGSLIAADSNLEITRPIWLIRDPESSQDLPSGCDP